MDENKFDRISEVDLKKTMESSYIDYAMSVIASRALPDVRDGLKPVQRRILYAMKELSNTPDKPHRKCARIVGDTMGKYHPHGDSSIYGALVNLAQSWTTRYPLVDGHGNFGSVDGDSAAAMRYTEARLSKISVEMLSDIEKDTVDFIPNFDETEKEPTVLPARYPNLLVNGTSGIAVGMATNIPPHNLSEVIDAVVKIIDDKIEGIDTEISELIKIVKGPDFPTGAEILGKAGIKEAYMTGRGKILVRAVTEIEPMQNGKNRIVVKELPYLVNKSRLIENIADLVKNKKIDGITELRDESNRKGMRICIELRRDVNPQITLKKLYKHTQLQSTFSTIMLALVNNEPVIMNLKQMLTFYLEHQENVVRRRSKFELKKAEDRAHILKGLLVALDNIDAVIKIIRESENTQIAKNGLIERFLIDEVQAQAIVEMRLRALTGLEKEKLQSEYESLQQRIRELKEILEDINKLLSVIRTEINIIKEKYKDDRKTNIILDYSEIKDDDLIEKEDVVITMTNMGYIKRMTVDSFKSQNRGGKGIKGIKTIDEDFIEDLVITTTHQYILFFTNKGRVYRLKAYQIPEAGRNARGTAIVNLLQLREEERITAIININKDEKDGYLFMATKRGIVKRTSLSSYLNINSNGSNAINLKENDDLIEVKYTNDENDIFLISNNGMCIRFKENTIRPSGKTSMGVKGMTLNKDDEVVAMQLDNQGNKLLFVSENGYGKKTELSEFSVQGRGGKGIKCYKITDKTGSLVGIKAVNDDDEVLIINTEGSIIRISLENVSTTNRIASGVRLMSLDEDTRIVKLAKVRKEDNTEE